jgi:hypothetical protein
LAGPKPMSFEVSLNLPFGLGGVKGTWEPDETQRTAAWEMYVELVTRVAVVELGPAEGLLREALTSLHSLFGTTRDILRRHGPGVAAVAGSAEYSFGYLAVLVLNQVLRPVLATWHPALLAYESRRPPEVSPVDHERSWERAPELRQALGEVRGALAGYAELLGEVAGVPSLLLPAAART